MGNLIRKNVCPNCGSKRLELDALYQYSKYFNVNKNGKVSSKFKYVDQGPMECAYIHCKDCDWNSPDAECGSDEDGYLLMDEIWFDEDN